jgi:hypothetical protein
MSEEGGCRKAPALRIAGKQRSFARFVYLRSSGVNMAYRLRLRWRNSVSSTWTMRRLTSGRGSGDEQIMKHVNTAMGTTQLGDIGALQIERYKLDRLKQSASPATVNREVALLLPSVGFCWARRVTLACTTGVARRGLLPPCRPCRPSMPSCSSRLFHFETEAIFSYSKPQRRPRREALRNANATDRRDRHPD